LLQSTLTVLRSVNGSNAGSSGHSITSFDPAELVDYDALHGTSFDSFQPSSVRAGDLFTGGITIANVGKSAGVPLSVAYYAVPSSDPIPAAHAASAGFLIGRVSAPAVIPGSSLDAELQAIPFPSSIPAGDYRFAWVIDTSGSSGRDFASQPNGALLQSTLTVVDSGRGGGNQSDGGSSSGQGGSSQNGGSSNQGNIQPGAQPIHHGRHKGRHASKIARVQAPSQATGPRSR
jgi:hypothetical protein